MKARSEPREPARSLTEEVRRLPRYEHRSRDWGEQHTYCPKCGFEGSLEHGLMRWWRPMFIAEHLAAGMVGHHGECLLVKCKVCAYAWTEDVLEPESPAN